MDGTDTNPKLIGAFVFGGVILLVAALVLFSSSDFFTPKRQFVAYFLQSINGLNVGAPVKFRGIPVGEVNSIEGIYDPDTGDVIPRLILELRPETLKNAVVEEGEYTLFPALVKHGMRASLKSQSLLTGQLYVGLDFHPDTPVRLMGEDDEYPEMPTIDSGLDEMLSKLSDLPIEELLVRATGALAAAEKVLRNPDVDETLAALPGLITDTNRAVVDLQAFVNSDLVELKNGANDTLATTRNSLEQLTSRLTGESLVQLDTTLTELNTTLQLIRKRLGRDDPLTLELLAALREASSALRSIRELADELEENPEALLKGKSTE